MLGLVVGWLVVVEGMGVVGVDGVYHMRVRLGGRDCWPRTGLSWWPWPVSMAWASLVFEVVGVTVGRGVGCGEGRCWPFMVSMGLAFRMFDSVGVVAGRGLGRCTGLFVVVFGVGGAGFSCVR